jgi:predicted P-loop ATPase
MSRSVGWLRLPYGMRSAEYPRQCVFAATTNKDDWNRSDTGARRFWPLACGCIDLDGLTAARDQLWAEARDRYNSGEEWWLTDKEVIAAAVEEQEARHVEDPLIPEVLEKVELLTSVSITELLTKIGFPKERQTRIDAVRMTSILRKLGWTMRKVRVGDKLIWRFFPPPKEKS